MLSLADEGKSRVKDVGELAGLTPKCSATGVEGGRSRPMETVRVRVRVRVRREGVIT